MSGERKAGAQPGMPSPIDKLRFAADQCDLQSFALAVGGPVLALVVGWLWRGWFSFPVALVITVGCLAAAYKIARGGVCTYTTNLFGKTAIVTGGNAGLGYENVKRFAEMGATVILACRDTAKGEAARSNILRSIRPSLKEDNSPPVGKIEVAALDVASKRSIAAFVKGLGDRDIHILVNNAGTGFVAYGLTEDGFEQVMGVNHLGPMYLTVLLLPTLRRCAARIVNVASAAHMFATVPLKSWAQVLTPTPDGYDPMLSYGNSKLGNVLFTRALEAKLDGSGAHAYAVHPGGVRTEIWGKARGTEAGRGLEQFAFSVGQMIFKTPAEGVHTQVYAAIHPSAQPVLYHADCRVAVQSPISLSDESAAECWAESWKVLKIEA